MNDQERRRAGRYDTLNLLDNIVLGQKGEPVARGMGRTLNISETGLLFESHLPYEPEQTLVITIALEDDLVEIKGRVRHVEPCGDKFRSGIEFLEIDDDDGRILKKYLKLFKAGH
ncbi:MAG TPA: PilZ domain-containing protein [Geobacteraceae bacterium]|jgi:c-di-GMP-binding flagellar brake protein YcgR|nr:PilZ domain-containing protein [Geobacteraceae bacterium]